MSEFRREKKILHQLVKARDAIRDKYNLLKLSKDNVKRALGETFQPIVEPLEKLVDNQSKEAVSRAVKHAEKSIKRDEKHNKSIKRKEEYGDDDMQDDTLQAETSVELAASNEGDNESHNKYLEMLSQDRYLDKIYGIRKENGGFMIGNSPINLEGIFIDVNGFIPFAKSDDYSNYSKILEATSARKKRYDSNERIRPHNSNKFKYIIAPMFEKQGGGVLPRYKLARMNTTMDYVYWDDPNELVERLRLLIAEQSTSNPSHVNEIHSIIEELREGGYIY